MSAAPGGSAPLGNPGPGCPFTPLAWSEPIRAELLAAIPASVITSAFGAGGEDPVAVEVLRADLGAGAQKDVELRAWLWSSWRHEHRDLVDALARLFSGRGRSELPALLRRHGAATLSLAVLSEPGEEPDELAQEALEQLPDDGDRKALRVALARWLAPDPGRAPIAGRLIVIGGHPRERARLEALLGPHAEDMKWIPAVKGARRGEAQLSLTAVSSADTVLIVTGRVSHTIMQSARKAADARGARCHFVEHVTERHVERLLEELRGSGAG